MKHVKTHIKGNNMIINNKPVKYVRCRCGKLGILDSNVPGRQKYYCSGEKCNKAYWYYEAVGYLTEGQYKAEMEGIKWTIKHINVASLNKYAT